MLFQKNTATGLRKKSGKNIVIRCAFPPLTPIQCGAMKTNIDISCKNPQGGHSGMDTEI